MLYDAILFDLDGTLVATDRFWVPAARTGCRAAFERLGLVRELPSAAAWMSIVGHPFSDGLRTLFPDLSEAERAEVGEACLAEEHRSLAAGGAAPMPGALELLRALRAAGLHLGVASNCAQGYLDHMLAELGFGALVDEARCLDSRGVANKADMIADLLATFGTHSAVFVGDRQSDREAAWANGLPHVHCRFGFAPDGEPTAAEAVIEDLGELPSVLERRRAWIEGALEQAGALRALAAAGAPIAVGVTGAPGVGKTLFARDAVAVFRSHGVPARVSALEDFAAPTAAARSASPEDPLGEGYDLVRLERELLAPLAAGSLATGQGADEGAGEAADVVVLEGPFLLDPRLRTRLAVVLHLEAPADVLLRRAAGRLRHGGDPRALADLFQRVLPLHRRFAERYPPERSADLVLDAANPLGLDPSARAG